MRAKELEYKLKVIFLCYFLVLFKFLHVSKNTSVLKRFHALRTLVSSALIINTR